MVEIVDHRLTVILAQCPLVEGLQLKGIIAGRSIAGF